MPCYSLQQTLIGPTTVTAADLAKHLRELFPDGLSLHGWSYILGTRPDNHIIGRVIPQDLVVEILFEYVRRAIFPHCQSRMQSYFAFVELGEARTFSATHGGAPVYRVNSARVDRHDQNWLRFGPQAACSTYTAHKYWSGEATETPAWEYLLAPPVNVIGRV